MTEFRNPPLSTKPDRAPVTPYLLAKQDWDQRIGSAVVQAKNWRLFSFSSALLSLMLSGVVLYQAFQPKVVPMVIAVNSKTGVAWSLGKAEKEPYEPKLQEIRYFVSEFIKKVRSVPSDPIVIKTNWLEAYKFLRQQAATVLNDITNADEESPLKRIGQKTVSVQPLSVTRVGQSQSYQARWREKVFEGGGAPLAEYVMSGVFTIEFEPPSSEEVLLVNPLGIFIKHFQWSKEI